MWFGAWLVMPTRSRKMLRDSGGELPTGEVSMSPSLDSPWESPAGPEAPREFLQQVDSRPETYVPFKSPKGAALIVVDRDEAEKVTLLDRLGQGLTVTGNVTKEANKNNAFSRKIKTAHDGVGLPIENTIAQDGSVTLVDLGGQSVELYTKKEITTDPNKARWTNKIKITSRQPFTVDNESPSGQKDTEGERFVNMELSGADGNFTLEVSGDPSQNPPIEKTYIHIDGNTGSIEINTPFSIDVKAKTITLTGSVLIDGDVTVSKQLKVSGDVLVSGDLLALNNEEAEFSAPTKPII
jgi:hypothetical protein